MNISYREIKPSVQLQDYIDCYWVQSFGGKTGDQSPAQRCLPLGMLEILVLVDDGCCEVSVNNEWQKLPHIFLAGVYQDPVLWRCTGNARKFGIRLKPETFHLLFNIPAATMFSDFTPLENIIGYAANEFAEKLTGVQQLHELVAITETFLGSYLCGRSMENNYIMEAAKLIRSAKGDISVEQVSDSVYVSMRQLQRSFRNTIGTSPKTYGRIIRFRNTFRAIRQLDRAGGWAGLSYTMGYADQAHLIREFKTFSGVIPQVMLTSGAQIHGLGEPGSLI